MGLAIQALRASHSWRRPPRRLGVVLVAFTVLSALPAGQAKPDYNGVEALFALYRSGAFDELDARARQIPNWKRVTDDLGRRRANWPAGAAAAFSLELAIAAANAGQDRLVFRPLVEAGCAFVRKAVPPLNRDDEVTWHLAALAVLHGHDDELPLGWEVGDTWEHFDHVQKLARDVTALRFGLAIMQEQMVQFSDAGRGHAFRDPNVLRAGSTTSRAYRARQVELLHVWRNRQIEDLIPRYSAFLADRDLGDEARLRLGVVLVKKGDVKAALLSLGQAATRGGNSWVRYLGHLFAGQTLLSVSRPTEAAGAFENALELYPNAGSALLGRSAALAMTGRIGEAARDAQAALHAGTTPDPYAEYYFGNRRFWPILRRSLREMAQ